MTPEERLDRLTERHEALAQSVEMLVSSIREMRAVQQVNEQRFAIVTRNFEVVLDSIKRLENIAMAHERRLDDLENR